MFFHLTFLDDLRANMTCGYIVYITLVSLHVSTTDKNFSTLIAWNLVRIMFVFLVVIQCAWILVGIRTQITFIHFFLLPFHFLFHFWMYFDFLHFQGQASQRTMTSVQNLNLKRRARSLFLYQNEKSIIFQSVHPPAFVACCNFMYLRNPCSSSDNGGVNWELNYRPSWVGVIQII